MDRFHAPGASTKESPHLSEGIDIPNHRPSRGHHPHFVSNECDTNGQNTSPEEDDNTVEAGNHTSGHQQPLSESPYLNDYIDATLQNQMTSLNTNDDGNGDDSGDAMQRSAGGTPQFPTEMMTEFVRKQKTYSNSSSTLGGSGGAPSVQSSTSGSTSSFLSTHTLTSILSSGGGNLSSKASTNSQSSTPENARKMVLVQDHDGTKMKPSRPTIAKKAKQPNVSKDIEQCRSQKHDNLDLSNQDLISPPSLKDLPSVKFLMLYQNKLTELPKSLCDMSNLEQLIVHQNSLQASGIPEELHRCSKLKVVDVRKNRLEHLPPKPLFQLPSLEHLFASYNRLTEIRPEIGNARTLTVLILSNNSLRVTLPATIGQLTALHTLDVSHNSLEYLPNEIGQCVSLKDLKLQHNRLTTLPDTIGNLKNLVKLGLKYNKLSSLPASLAQCTQLDEFNIENNLIVTLPDSLLARLPKVQTITLSRNNFSNFPPGGPHQFDYVQTLNLDHNHLDSVPVGIFSSATYLRKLKLTDNEITTLIPMDLQQHWTQLVELDLGSNQLRLIPPEISCLRNMEKLCLSYNHLKSLPEELCSLPNLQVLDLESNQLESLLPEIGQLKSLSELNLISNQLVTLPPSIGDLENLKKLRLSENNIRYLPPEIGNMGNLVELYLSDNSELDNLPVELASCSSLHILNLERCPLRDLPAQVVSGGSGLVIYFLQQVAVFRNSRQNLPPM